MSEWKEYKFSELCDITRGASPRPIKDFISNEGMPWVKIADATSAESRFIEQTKERIKLEGVEKSKSVFPGDLILSNSATPGLPMFMKIEACIHDGWMLLRNFRGLNKRFAYWLLLHERKSLVMHGNGSVFVNLKTDILKDHEVVIPDEAEQERIADILDSIAEKIELNRQIKQTLESMAQTIFKSWFVDFEPVKAKIAAIEAGEDAEGVTRAAMRAISGKTDDELDQMQAGQTEHYAQLKTTAELFPSAMQDSELGEVPEGGEVRTLGSLSAELRRGISPKYTEEGGILVINQKCIRSHSVDFSLARRNDTKLRKVKGREIQVGDILVNSTGVGTLGRLAPIRYLPEPAVVDSHVTVVRASNEVTPSFLNEYMLTKESFIEASGAGSTGQTELRKQVLEELFVAVLNRTLIESFEIIHEPISLLIAKRELESQSLTQLRDTLLPKLLSGELEVNDANKVES